MPALCQEAFRLIPDRLDVALTMPFLLKEPSVWTLACLMERAYLDPTSQHSGAGKSLLCSLLHLCGLSFLFCNYFIILNTLYLKSKWVL